MVQFEPVSVVRSLLIDSYGNSGFRIGGTFYKGSVLILPEQIVSWDVSDIASITPDSLGAIFDIATTIDLVMFGTGPEHQLITPDLEKRFRDVMIGVEPMATAAACRTYNVALAEDRRLAAVLIAVE